MPAPPVETGIPIIADRNFPTTAFGQAAAAMEAAGSVDYFQVWDQLTSWYPQGLWTPENTPLAGLMPDCDSFPRRVDHGLVRATRGAPLREEIGWRPGAHGVARA